MNLHGISKLCCPMCGGVLKLHSFHEETIEVDPAEVARRDPNAEIEQLQTVIRDGVLTCESCRVWYPIESYVPVMLIFRIPFHQYFKTKHADSFQNVPGIDRLEAPNETANPGERSVQQTFTEEWDTVLDNELTFSYTKEDLQYVHQKVWLQWEEPPSHVKTILNIGCGGLGAEAEALHAISDADVFGLDLNLTLLHAGPRFVKEPFFHLVIASLFHSPFEKKSFDLVYSQGVLHHTFSTEKAFESSAELVADDGEICIWVYGLEDHLAGSGLSGWVQRLKYYGEEYLGFRFLISRAPAFVRGTIVYLMSLVAHPFFRSVKQHGGTWKLANTQHSIRDRLTPRFAFKHSFNEVVEWYERLGFTIQVHSPTAYKERFKKALWGIGVYGRRKKS